MSISEESLFLNEAFYEAFRERDLEAMDLLWAIDSPVVCIHPGWSAITKREDIIDSWRGIFESPESPQIHCRRPQAFHMGDVVSIVCYEEMEGGLLVATNMFRRCGAAVKLIHHQAGTSRPPPRGLGKKSKGATLQ